MNPRTAPLPGSAAGHSMGKEPARVSRRQKPVLCGEDGCSALTLGKAELRGLMDLLAQRLYLTPHWAPRPLESAGDQVLSNVHLGQVAALSYLIYRKRMRADKIGQQVTVLATKTDDLSSIPEEHTVEGEK